VCVRRAACSPVVGHLRCILRRAQHFDLGAFALRLSQSMAFDPILFCRRAPHDNVVVGVLCLFQIVLGLFQLCQRLGNLTILGDLDVVVLCPGACELRPWRRPGRKPWGPCTVWLYADVLDGKGLLRLLTSQLQLGPIQLGEVSRGSDFLPDAQR